ncbi:hypothetical protein C9374_009415 [Naegleria lovaniensis]|uniref:ELP1 alpha-solenoid domain-containing protein n=1 Tax=Naegleria lovaniensis TaxID=51637 RepID=A0AA88KK53_NAELO|nr:uncharacterized protein C9374_009415 [Naegleria lovaniensis]KAG2377504.1 hypothetical protein C9374_009415 [Naegleria lovaniensis]
MKISLKPNLEDFTRMEKPQRVSMKYHTESKTNKICTCLREALTQVYKKYISSILTTYANIEQTMLEDALQVIRSLKTSDKLIKNSDSELSYLVFLVDVNTLTAVTPSVLTITLVLLHRANYRVSSIQEKSLVIKKELDESKTKETPSMAPELDICGMDLHDMFDLDPKPESTPQVTTFKSPVLEFQIFKLDQLKKQIFINAKQDCDTNDKDMQNSTKFLKTMKDMEENNSKVIADQLLKIQKEKEELLERFKKQEEDIAKQEEQYVKPLTKLVNEVAKLIEVKKEKIRQKEEEEKNQIEANYQSLFD